MQYILLAAALVVLAPIACAQTSTGTASKPGVVENASQVPPGYTVQPPDPNNCGTPYQPYPCNKAAAQKTTQARKPSS
jgi:hypothetical protein